MSDKKSKNINVERLTLQYDNQIHEFRSYNSPFVCKACSYDDDCTLVLDGYSEEPIEFSHLNKFEKQYKYESLNFYGEGYVMDILVIEIRLINAYAFTVLVSRESPFSEIHLDFHEITSSSTLTPKYIHKKILETVVISAKEIESFQKILKLKRGDVQDTNKGLNLELLN